MNESNEKTTFVLGKHTEAFQNRLTAWEKEKTARRIWGRDGTVWISDLEPGADMEEVTNRLGWLTAPQQMIEEVPMLNRFAEEIRNEGYTRIVLLGMGGSSLAPEVLSSTFGSTPGYPEMTVLDSTHPEAIRSVLEAIDKEKTLFTVSSKSGGTIETISLFKFFFDKITSLKESPGQDFIAITDPGSGLESIAAKYDFRRVFNSPRDVGGRYSALTYFGLVPAALMGINLEEILERAIQTAVSTYPEGAIDHNPGLTLGAAIGELTLAGCDKITFLKSPHISAFGAWLEQLIAESTGKDGTGLLPVDGEKLALHDFYSADRIFAYLRLTGDDNEEHDNVFGALQDGGHPAILARLEDLKDLGGEFFRWEMAVAAAGAILGINPFDQPNVEASKKKANELITAYRNSGSLPGEQPALTENGFELYGGIETSSADTFEGRLLDFFAQARAGDYVAIMAFIPCNDKIERLLSKIRFSIRARLGLATTLGYGPRYLHSTGQLHKGDGNRGLFIQITHTPQEDIPIPGEGYSFGTLISAQSLGDYWALKERGRRVIRFHVKGEPEAALEQLGKVLAL